MEKNLSWRQHRIRISRIKEIEQIECFIKESNFTVVVTYAGISNASGIKRGWDKTPSKMETAHEILE